MGGFSCFLAEHRAGIQQSLPCHAASAQVAQKALEQWRALAVDAKRVYLSKALEQAAALQAQAAVPPGLPAVPQRRQVANLQGEPAVLPKLPSVPKRRPG